MEHENIPSATLLKIKKETFLPIPVSMLLLYRKHGVSLDNLTYLITHFISKSNSNIKIILRDFNMNGFEQNKHLENILADYTWIVNQPSHLLGSLLGHVYIKMI